jgi:prophage regulatory protein
VTKQYLTYKQVCARVALARSTVTRMVRLGEFPRPVKIGTHSVRFVENDVIAWQAMREAFRAGGQP